MDDTFLKEHTEHKYNFPKHINNTDSAIKFTAEDTRPDGSMTFSETLSTRNTMGPLPLVFKVIHPYEQIPTLG